MDLKNSAQPLGLETTQGLDVAQSLDLENEAQSTHLRAKVKAYIEENQLSQSKFAGLVGINNGALSAWLGGKYAGNNEKVALPIANFFEKQGARSEQATLDEIAFAETGISQKITSILNYCRTQGIIGCIYGDAGVGKTATAREWAKDKTDVIYITATVANCNPKPFFKKLAKELKTTRRGQLDDIYTDVVEKLAVTSKTLIIDEAQHLTLKALELVRSLNDETGTSIALIGNDKVYSKLLGKQQAEFAQLFSRIGMKMCVLTDNFKIADIKAIFTNRLDNDANKFMLDIAKSRYGLRGAINVFLNASNNGDTSKEGLMAIASTMGIVV